MRDRSIPRTQFLLEKFFDEIKALDSSQSKNLFDHRMFYFTHELNGTKIFNNNSIYQGYFLMTTNRIDSLGKMKIEAITDDKSNTEV